MSTSSLLYVLLETGVTTRTYLKDYPLAQNSEVPHPMSCKTVGPWRFVRFRLIKMSPSDFCTKWYANIYIYIYIHYEINIIYIYINLHFTFQVLPKHCNSVWLLDPTDTGCPGRPQDIQIGVPENEHETQHRGFQEGDVAFPGGDFQNCQPLKIYQWLILKRIHIPERIQVWYICLQLT